MFALVFTFLGLLLSVNAQLPSPTASLTITPSITISITTSITATNSVTNSATGSLSTTQSITATTSWTSTSSWTKTATTSNTASVSPSSSATPTSSITYPTPPAPINVLNKCPGHAVTVCLTWNDPTGTYIAYSVFYKLTSSTTGVFLQIDTTDSYLVINNLRAGTSFDFIVVGFNGLGVESLPSDTATFVTGPQTPKQNTALDISNVQCAQTVNVNTSRVNIQCTWSPPPTGRNLYAIEVKCRCVSSVRTTVRIRKDLSGAALAANAVTFKINRDVANCNIYIKALYGKPPGKLMPGTRQHIALVVGV